MFYLVSKSIIISILLPSSKKILFKVFFSMCELLLYRKCFTSSDCILIKSDIWAICYENTPLLSICSVVINGILYCCGRRTKRLKTQGWITFL